MSERYIVDDRIGCVAVRDSFLIDPDEPGVHGDEDDIKMFRLKERREVPCEHCHHVRYEYVDDDHVAEAEELAAKLNLADEESNDAIE